MRKSPSESATEFKVGTKKKGNDGNMWKITKTISGTHRWVKILTSKKASKTDNVEISLIDLYKMKKKYNLSINGTKNQLAEQLWKFRNYIMENKDIELIIPLLSKKEQKKAEKIIKKRINNPITNYKGLWRSLQKPLNKMSRDELILDLCKFRDAWEKITKRNQDLDDSRLENETVTSLRSLLKFYYSNDAKLLAEDWLR
jgi:hypothetical protein